MLTPAVIDLTERLPELKEMLNRSLRGDITIEVVVPDQSCAVKVDPSELELALLNLAVNARDAMPNGGALSITAKPVMLQGKAAEEELSGEFVAICVADTGIGIPADILPHVFEPFFTTKEVGKGTGLGLSQVYGFAKQSGGTATITSTVGRGTVITLYLPRTQELPAPSIARMPSPRPRRRRPARCWWSKTDPRSPRSPPPISSNSATWSNRLPTRKKRWNCSPTIRRSISSSPTS